MIFRTNTENELITSVIPDCDVPEMIDEYCWTERRKIIPNERHHVEGLGNFSHMNPLNAGPPSPWHIHKNLMEIHSIVKGKRISVIQTHEDGRCHSYTSTGNEATIVFPGEIHSNGDSPMNPCEFYAIQLDLHDGNHFLGLSPEYGNFLCSRLKQLSSRHLQISPHSQGLVRRAFELFPSEDPFERHMGVQLLVCFLYELLASPSINDQVPLERNGRIQLALEYIDQNISKPMNLEEIAAVTGYSLSRFKTKFRDEVGTTPSSYLTARKIEFAKLLLEQTDTSITDLSYNLGWSSSNYFCNVFKKMTGISPMQYRKERSQQI